MSKKRFKPRDAEAVDKLLATCNQVRKISGDTLLKKLNKGIPNEAEACLVSKNIHPRCLVIQVENHWLMILPCDTQILGKVAKRRDVIAKKMGWTPISVRTARSKSPALVLPRWLGREIDAFDHGAYPKELYAPSTEKR